MDHPKLKALRKKVQAKQSEIRSKPLSDCFNSKILFAHPRQHTIVVNLETCPDRSSQASAKEGAGVQNLQNFKPLFQSGVAMSKLDDQIRETTALINSSLKRSKATSAFAHNIKEKPSAATDTFCESQECINRIFEKFGIKNEEGVGVGKWIEEQKINTEHKTRQTGPLQLQKSGKSKSETQLVFIDSKKNLGHPEEQNPKPLQRPDKSPLNQIRKEIKVIDKIDEILESETKLANKQRVKHSSIGNKLKKSSTTRILSLRRTDIFSSVLKPSTVTPASSSAHQRAKSTDVRKPGPRKKTTRREDGGGSIRKLRENLSLRKSIKNKDPIPDLPLKLPLIPDNLEYFHIHFSKIHFDHIPVKPVFSMDNLQMEVLANPELSREKSTVIDNININSFLESYHERTTSRYSSNVTKSSSIARRTRPKINLKKDIMATYQLNPYLKNVRPNSNVRSRSRSKKTDKKKTSENGKKMSLVDLKKNAFANNSVKLQTLANEPPKGGYRYLSKKLREFPEIDSIVVHEMLEVLFEKDENKEETKELYHSTIIDRKMQKKEKSVKKEEKEKRVKKEIKQQLPVLEKSTPHKNTHKDISSQSIRELQSQSSKTPQKEIISMNKLLANVHKEEPHRSRNKAPMQPEFCLEVAEKAKPNNSTSTINSKLFENMIHLDNEVVASVEIPPNPDNLLNRELNIQPITTQAISKACKSTPDKGGKKPALPVKADAEQVTRNPNKLRRDPLYESLRDTKSLVDFFKAPTVMPNFTIDLRDHQESKKHKEETFELVHSEKSDKPSKVKFNEIKVCRVRQIRAKVRIEEDSNPNPISLADSSTRIGAWLRESEECEEARGMLEVTRIDLDEVRGTVETVKNDGLGSKKQLQQVDQDDISMSPLRSELLADLSSRLRSSAKVITTTDHSERGTHSNLHCERFTSIESSGKKPSYSSSVIKPDPHFSKTLPSGVRMPKKIVISSVDVLR